KHRQESASPRANVRDESQHSGQQCPQRRIWNSDELQPKCNTDAVTRIDEELGGKVTRYTTSSVFHCARGCANTPLPNETNQSAAKIFSLQQHENNEQQHQSSGAERTQNRAESLLH